MPTYTFTSSLLTSLNKYGKFNALNTPFYDADYILGVPAGFILEGSPTGSNRMEKYPFSDETTSVLTRMVLPATAGGTGYGTSFKSSTDGYFVGGSFNGSVTSTGVKFSFSSETIGNLSSTLSAATYDLGGFFGSLAGYAFGGSPWPTFISTVAKFTFSNDSRSNLPTGLSSARYRLVGFESSTTGYATGGVAQSSPPQVTVDKFAFSNDARTTGTSLSPGTDLHGTFASSTNGYVIGGRGGSTNVQKYTFSNDTRANLPSASGAIDTYNPSYYYFARGINSTTAGYMHGNDNTKREKWNFSDDTKSIVTTSPRTVSKANAVSFT
jgi:hypothetical protein